MPLESEAYLIIQKLTAMGDEDEIGEENTTNTRMFSKLGKVVA